MIQLAARLRLVTILHTQQRGFLPGVRTVFDYRLTETQLEPRSSFALRDETSYVLLYVIFSNRCGCKVGVLELFIICSTVG